MTESRICTFCFDKKYHAPEVDIRAGSRFTRRKCNYARFFLSKHKGHLSVNTKVSDLVEYVKFKKTYNAWRHGLYNEVIHILLFKFVADDLPTIFSNFAYFRGDISLSFLFRNIVLNFTIIVDCSKGQLISGCLFDNHKFSKKTNKQFNKFLP